MSQSLFLFELDIKHRVGHQQCEHTCLCEIEVYPTYKAFPLFTSFYYLSNTKKLHSYFTCRSLYCAHSLSLSAFRWPPSLLMVYPEGRRILHTICYVSLKRKHFWVHVSSVDRANRMVAEHPGSRRQWQRVKGPVTQHHLPIMERWWPKDAEVGGKKARQVTS